MSEHDLNNTVTPNPKLAVDYCGIKMKNPIIAASGTFGNGPEYAGYPDQGHRQQRCHRQLPCSVRWHGWHPEHHPGPGLRRIQRRNHFL